MVDFTEPLRQEAAAEGRRAARIAAIQQQIADGTYDSEAKFEAAFEKMLGLYEAGQLDCSAIDCGAAVDERPKKAR